MEQVDLEKYGFIKSVDLCIKLLREFGDKITPELLKEYLGEETERYINTQDFLASVVEAVQSGGGDFLNKMEELYSVKDEILKVIEPKNLIDIIEGQTRKVCEETIMDKQYIENLASFVLAQSRFRDYLYAYTKQEVSKALDSLDIEVIVSDIVKENADIYAQYLLETTKQKQLEAEASLLVIQQIEKVAYLLYPKILIYDPDYIHRQKVDGLEIPKQKEE